MKKSVNAIVNSKNAQTIGYGLMKNVNVPHV